MFIKSIQFLSGSLQQEAQRFVKDQRFSQTYSEMDKEFRSERVAVQAQDPTKSHINGFVGKFEAGKSVNNDMTSPQKQQQHRNQCTSKTSRQNRNSRTGQHKQGTFLREYWTNIRF